MLSGVVGILAVPPLLAVIARRSRSGTTLTVAALVIVLGLAVLADSAQLAFIIGAFMAGLAIGRSGQHERIANDLNSIGGVLIPVFFVLIGVNADVGAMFQPSVLLDAAVLLVIAVAGKMVSAYGAAGTRSDRLLIGLGMIPRGEVGLIFASIGLAQGVLDDELYGALLLVVLMTTVITPPLLRWRIASRGRADIGELDEDVTPEPAGGWAAARDGWIVLDGRPPANAVAVVALQAAALADHGAPSDELLSWFGERRDVDLDWTLDDTNALLDVLRHGGPRAVRLLDITGVLERGVPLVAEALAHRRADPSELDPGRALRFPTVARLADHPIDPTVPWDPGHEARARNVTLAALAIDVLGIDASSGAIHELLAELAVEDPTVERTIETARLLRAAASDVDGYDRAEMTQLAAHVGTLPMLDPAHEVALASTPDDDRRDRLAQVRELLAEILAHPELLGPDATSLADTRRRAALAMAADDASRRRLQDAPDGYVLAHERRRAGPPGPARRAAARQGHGACRRESGGHARSLDRRHRQPRCRRAAGPPRRGPHGIRLRHRRGHRRHVARRRRGRHVPGARRSSPTGAATGDPDRIDARRATDPRADRSRRGAVRQRRRAVAHGVHDHRTRPAGHARRAGGCVRGRRRDRAQRPADELRWSARRPLRADRSARAQARRKDHRARRRRARRTSTAAAGPPADPFLTPARAAPSHQNAPERNRDETLLCCRRNADPLNWRTDRPGRGDQVHGPRTRES